MSRRRNIDFLVGLEPENYRRQSNYDSTNCNTAMKKATGNHSATNVLAHLAWLNIKMIILILTIDPEHHDPAGEKTNDQSVGPHRPSAREIPTRRMTIQIADQVA